MFGLGAQEVLVILVIVLVLFGGSKLPDLREITREVDEGIQEGDRGRARGGAGLDAATHGGAASVCALQEPARDRLESLPPAVGHPWCRNRLFRSRPTRARTRTPLVELARNGRSHTGRPLISPGRQACAGLGPRGAGHHKDSSWSSTLPRDM